MKLSKSRLQNLISENNREILLYTRLISEKTAIKNEYGYEEKGEEISRYENLLKLANETKSDIENGKYYC